MQQRQIVRVFWSVLFVALLGSCSPFSKLQKNGTQEEKYKGALEYYKKEDWYRAGMLFEELIPVLKGSNESEMAQFYYAYTQYHQQLYSVSAQLFKRFYETFARSEKAQEAQYMYALSQYKDTPKFNLDQSNTVAAMSALQDFINSYPESEFREGCTKMILELRQRLEQKAYEKAKLYHKTSGFNIASLKSAVVSIDNFQKEFPDSEYNEELAFLKVDSQYNYAVNSLETKQKERFQDAVTFYQAMVDKYPSSKYLKQAEKMYETSVKEVERLAKLEKEKEQQKQNDANRPAKVTAASN
ncbi:outer membrane protein assembly factor BamD [Rudanella paleaurantiibacter]|uniref:Outer membrane protein assembly factor BamD n=1 Tax=Rudanella paleaurantiibacter TaxID=2614655 RepID=A0A7J5TUX4_9BACT|nr:outer membrane protein assembly factor BamD [Rudanella paleaurantiibacter]KAB7727945.1 outer membrane protein assembly factor BamD [Rudanella paleaurantiibacter]